MKKIIFVSALLFATQPTLASELKSDFYKKLTIGALANFSSDAYAVDDDVGVLPLVLYADDYVYVEGDEAGFYAYQDSKNRYRVGISYEGRSFDPKDAKTAELSALDNRKASANITASYMRLTPIGGFELMAMTDMMDRSGGQSLSLAHRSRFYFADNKLVIYPKVGLMWYSDEYNQYYFGVSDDEATRTGLRAYTLDSSVSPFLSVSGKYNFTEHLGVFASTHAQWLNSDQKHSPLVDNSTDISANLGLTYTF